MRGLSLVAASGGHSSSWCVGLSLSQPLLLRSTGSRHAGSVIVAHGPSCSTACGIVPDQGPNLCPLHWQADSQPLHHQGSPIFMYLPYTFYQVDCLSPLYLVLLLGFYIVFHLEHIPLSPSCLICYFYFYVFGRLVMFPVSER